MYAGVRRLLFCSSYNDRADHFVPDFPRISALVAVTVAANCIVLGDNQIDAPLGSPDAGRLAVTDAATSVSSVSREEPRRFRGPW
jgi:hypothetical protein